MSVININEITQYLPHRFPFLFIDRVLEWEPNQSLLAYKNVTINEPFFAGHFPQRPIMPGVLIIEALAQAVGILMLKSNESSLDSGTQKKQDVFFLAGVDEARFKRVVEPGDQLQLEVKVLVAKRNIWKCSAMASVAGQLACSAVIMVMRGSESA
jgi:3-hydroxyacyl-[acyl-carrier-protein] dehydratase